MKFWKGKILKKSHQSRSGKREKISIGIFLLLLKTFQIFEIFQTSKTEVVVIPKYLYFSVFKIRKHIYIEFNISKGKHYRKDPKTKSFFVEFFYDGKLCFGKIEKRIKPSIYSYLTFQIWSISIKLWFPMNWKWLSNFVYLFWSLQ